MKFCLQLTNKTKLYKKKQLWLKLRAQVSKVIFHNSRRIHELYCSVCAVFVCVVHASLAHLSSFSIMQMLFLPFLSIKSTWLGSPGFGRKIIWSEICLKTVSLSFLLSLLSMNCDLNFGFPYIWPWLEQKHKTPAQVS